MKYLLTLLLFISTVLSAEPVMVKNSLDCGNWLKSRSNNSDIFEAEITGFINGYALGSTVDVWRRPNEMTPEQVYFYVDKECKADPLKYVEDILDLFLTNRRFSATK